MLRRLWIGNKLHALAIAVATTMAGCGDVPTAPATPRPTGPTYVLSGIVTERLPSDPVPASGAMVRHVESGRWAMTDGSGSYTMSGVPPGAGTVVVSKDGYTSVTTPVVVTSDTRLDLELRRPPSQFATLSGTVYEQTSAGRVPIEGVRVEESYRRIVSMTDANGRYSLFMNVPDFDGFAKIDVTKEGFQPQQKNLVVDEDTTLDIAMVRR